MKFADTSKEKLKKIAELAFGYPDWIKSEIKIEYSPFNVEHFSDADEYFLMSFEGLFVGEQTANYIVQLRPSLDIAMFYEYPKGTPEPMHPQNQAKIQQLLQEKEVDENHRKVKVWLQRYMFDNQFGDSWQLHKVETETEETLVTVSIHLGRPGLLIGKQGKTFDKVKEGLARLVGKDVKVLIVEQLV